MAETDAKLASVLSAIDQVAGFAPLADLTPEPSVLLQNRTTTVFLSGGPKERFSDRIIALPPELAGSYADLVPIDLLLGSYDPKNRLITIYVEMIKKIAKRFTWQFDDLLFLVRLHEYAHALVHLGVWQAEVERVLSRLDSSGYTNWGEFLARRDSAFEDLSEEEHEFLAQGVSFTALNGLQGQKGFGLRDLFEELENKQPPAYRLSANVKSDIKDIDWSLTLRVSQKEKEVDETLKGTRSTFELLVDLVRSSSDLETEEYQRDWRVSLDDARAVADLRSEISKIEMGRRPSGDNAELLVERIGELRIEVFSREHPPPHFRVICGSESANFRIKDGSMINGRLDRYARVIKKWHKKHRDLLIETWDSRRPSDCPVGEYRE